MAGSVGPLTAPFFLPAGLTKGAYLRTEALAAVVTHAAKLATYGAADLLTGPGAGLGVALGAVMAAGSYLGKRAVDRLSEAAFTRVVEAALAASGAYLLAVG